jgi:hypothetical protein
MTPINENEVFVDDVGVEIVLDTHISLSNATLVQIKVRLPNGKNADWNGTVIENTRIKHVIAQGELKQAGVYKLQAYAETPVWKLRGDTVHLEVLPKFGESSLSE